MSAYLCSDDTLNALSTYWFIKSGKSWDDPSKAQAYKRAMRISYKDSWYEGRYESMQTFEDRMKLHAKFEKHIDEHYEKSMGYAILNQIKDYLLEDMKLGEIWDFNEQRFIAQMEKVS